MPKRWSTKNLHVLEPPTPERTGVGIFEFTDDYSVFHYSKMPDQIPDKGEALCRMAAATLQMIARLGISTHFRRFIPPKSIEIRLVRVLDPAKGELSLGDRSRLVPLQVICRNQLPPGASVFRRLEKGTVTLQQLGLSTPPVPGQRLDPPLIEFTTKLEEIDRFITEPEAQEMACLTDEQLQDLKHKTLQINEAVTRKAESLGLVHADSKIEFGIDEQGEVMLVDTAGTPDENRFLRNGFHVTKQMLRDFYLVRGLESDVQRWAAQGRPRSTWARPEPLPPEYIATASDMYKALSELWIGERVWQAPPLDEVIGRLQHLQACSPAVS